MMNDDSLWDALEKAGPAPEEPKLRQPSKKKQIDATEVMSKDAQGMLFLAGAAIYKMGGALVLSKDELKGVYRIGFDLSYNDDTGGLRVYSIKVEDDGK